MAVVAAAIPDALRPEVVRLTAEAVDRIALVLDGDRRLVWGSAEESELKAEVAAALFASVDAEVYDVSAPATPPPSEVTHPACYGASRCKAASDIHLGGRMNVMKISASLILASLALIATNQCIR